MATPQHPVHFIRALRVSVRTGKKTMTHRVMKPQPSYVRAARWLWEPYNGRPFVWSHNPSQQYIQSMPLKWVVGHEYWLHEPISVVNPYLKTGTIVIRYEDDGEIRVVTVPKRVKFPSVGKWGGRTLPPEWARDFILCEKVVVRMIQDITKKECEAEGIYSLHSQSPGLEAEPYYKSFQPPKRLFEMLWDSINAKRGYSFESNPWCVGATFKYLPRRT